MQGQPEGEGKEIKFIYIATRQPRITKYLRKCATRQKKDQNKQADSLILL